MNSKKIAIVTGASSGMGREFVLQIAGLYKNLDEIWVIARREDRLKELRSQTDIKLVPIVMDLQNPENYKFLQNKLKEENPNVRMLVNSAGFGIHGYFEEQKTTDVMGMIELNCLALSKITHICLNYMHTNSRIINLASAASFVPQKRFAVYAASKSYVLSFSRALNVELKDRKVFVTAVCPGPVDTEFFKKDDCDINKTFYKKMVMAKPKEVVTLALKDSVKEKEISVYGTFMKMFYVLTKVVPHRIILFVTKFIL